ncbi:hypothetical protein UPYG_G00065880 [Umbra pygmaea]|uniref:Ig-like domain-containing protein n=1 Tax=Umbra pygmaea TaxID=75934 RepID=A0ABD0XV51_UMBPY
MFVRSSKMTSSWLFLVICFVFTSASEKFVNLVCKNEYHGVHGQKSLLECIVKPIKPCIITGLTWKIVRGDVTLLEYHGDKISPTPGFTFAEPDWNNRNLNVSLLLTNTKMEDEGEYECVVCTDRGDDIIIVNLSVTAKYTSPEMSSIPENKVKENEAVYIFCNSTGQHGMIWWFNMLGQNCTNDSRLDTKINKDGLFSLSSKLTVEKATSNNSYYTCNVLSVTGAQKETASFQLQFETNGQEQDPNTLEQATSPDNAAITNWLAPVVVIGSLIVGLLIALLFCKRRTQRRPNDHPTSNAYDIEAVKEEIEDLNSTG